MSNMNLSTLAAHWKRTPRHIQFAVELAVAAFIAVGGSWLAAKAGGKLNAKSNADVRASFAQVRIAEALERAYPPRDPLPRPSLLGPREWTDSEGLLHRTGNIRIIERPAPDPDPEPCRAALSRLQPERCGL